MRETDFLEALGQVDEKYINEVVRSELEKPEKKISKRPDFRFGGIAAAAACIAVVCGTLFFIRGLGVGRADPNGFVIKNGVLIAYNGNAESLTIPDSVTEIADGAFASNKNSANIRELKLGSSLTDLEAADLEGLSALECLDAGNSKAFTERDGVVISNCGEVLLRGLDQTAVSYSIPDGVLWIAPCAFTSSYSLESVDFGDTVSYIGFNAFAGTSLKSIDLPDSVKTIAHGAFRWCAKAIKGRIPSGATYADDSFKYVPFYIKLTTGKTTPAEDIANGMTPSEAIRLSDTDSLISEINSLLKKIHEAAADEGDSYRVTYKSGIDVTVNSRYPEKLPESVEMSDLSFTDNGWGQTGIYDIRIDLDCGDFKLCMEAYAYAAFEKTSWDEVTFRIENIYFHGDKPESSFDIGGGWSALVDTSGGQTQTQIILRNTDDRQISTIERVDAQSDFGFFLSPGGDYLAIEYGRNGEEKHFLIQSLIGYVFDGMNYRLYINEYYGSFEGGLEWIDEKTIAGKNEFGKFRWNLDDSKPKLDYSEIPTGTKEITCLNSSAAYKVTLQIPASWLDRGYYSDMEREKANKHSTSRLICDNVMPTAGLITESGEWNPDALDDMGWYSEASAINCSETDSGLRYMQITIYRLGSDGKYTSYKLAFCKGDRVEFTMEMTSYGDDPEEYYTDVLLPVIMSVEITED